MNEEYTDIDDDYPRNVEENYTLQLTLAIHQDNEEYFIKLLSPSVFIQMNIEDKLRQAISVVGLSKEKNIKYLNNLIFHSEIKENFFDNYHDFGFFDLNYIKRLYQIKNLNNELPINNIKEEKRTKV